MGAHDVLTDPFSSVLGILLYGLLNWSYTTAVFTDPGSPSATSGSAGYSHLPTHEPHRDASSFTVKSTGGSRYCKKCQSRKPDRAHHCSTCGRCVLKMDHHCPWLATCVGLRNYKAFLLFLCYTSIYCWVCFAVTSIWLWNEVFSDGQYTDSFMPINYILLCVISGIIGLVLTGFTIWHLTLAFNGQTTIECLERTRYLTPLRKSMERQQLAANGVRGQSYGQQLAEIHANALPGVTRPEEGEEMVGNGDLERGHQSRAQDSLQRNFAEMERSRERERYEDYLDEKDSEKLPNAFDIGWRRNLVHLLGEKPLLRFLPVCNTTGDGWHWDPNPKWLEAREAIRRERDREWQEQEARGYRGDSAHNSRRWPTESKQERHYVAANGTASNNGTVLAGNGGLGRSIGYFNHSPDDRPSSRMSMKTIRRRGSFDSASEEDGYDVSSDEEERHLRSNRQRIEDDARKQD